MKSMCRGGNVVVVGSRPRRKRVEHEGHVPCGGNFVVVVVVYC